MRKLIYAINMSLDGCCDHTVFTPCEEMYDYHTQLLRDADLLVYGRKTYELMVPYWPDIAKNLSGDKSENEFAKVFDGIDRLVFSHTLKGSEDPKTRIVHTSAADEIQRLKKEPGKDMLIGGVSLPSQFMKLGLIDEYHFVYLPVVAGAGTRLLAGVDLAEQFQLRLVGSKIFKSGVVALHFVKH